MNKRGAITWITAQVTLRNRETHLSQMIGFIVGQLVDRHSFWAESIPDITIETAS